MIIWFKFYLNKISKFKSKMFIKKWKNIQKSTLFLYTTQLQNINI